MQLLPYWLVATREHNPQPTPFPFPLLPLSLRVPLYFIL